MSGESTRRALLGGSAALATTGMAAATDPDAELLAAIAAFDALERRIGDMHRGIGGAAEEEEAEARSAPLEERQHELLAIICGTRARTTEGLRARARSFLAWDREIIKTLAEDDPDDYSDRRMIAALLRDLVGSTAA